VRKFFFPVFLVSIALFASTVYSQGLESPIRVYSPRLETPIKIMHPDFSGTWKLNFLRSGFTDAMAKDVSDSSLIVLIDQKLPVIYITLVARHLAETEKIAEFYLYTDGRASEFPRTFSSSSVAAEWNGESLVVMNFTSARGVRTVLNVGELKLSVDGNTLTFTEKRTQAALRTDGRSRGIVEDIKTASAIFDRIVDIPARSNKIPLPEEK
jgi:hypothetical protein